MKLSEVRVVILAAGQGKRLGQDTPKAIVELDGKTLFGYQVDSLEEYFDPNQISVVVGYKKNQIMDRFPNRKYIFNDDFDDTNTAKSLLEAFQSLGEGPTIWMNGDIYFDSDVIGLLVKNIKRNNGSRSLVLVDNKECGQEEIKYSVDGEGKINTISKEVSKPLGEALGINYISAPDSTLLHKHLSLVDDLDYFEKALENMVIKERTHFFPVDIGNLFCKEIDFPEDLQEVLGYVKTKKEGGKLS